MQRGLNEVDMRIRALSRWESEGGALAPATSVTMPDRTSAHIAARADDSTKHEADRESGCSVSQQPFDRQQRKDGHAGASPETYARFLLMHQRLTAALFDPAKGSVGVHP